jgi:hypothetical protein
VPPWFAPTDIHTFGFGANLDARHHEGHRRHLLLCPVPGGDPGQIRTLHRRNRLLSAAVPEALLAVKCLYRVVRIQKSLPTPPGVVAHAGLGLATEELNARCLRGGR